MGLDKSTSMSLRSGTDASLKSFKRAMNSPRATALSKKQIQAMLIANSLALVTGSSATATKPLREMG